MTEVQKDLEWAMKKAVIEEGVRKKIILTESARSAVNNLSYDKLYSLVFKDISESDITTFLTEDIDVGAARDKFMAGAKASGTSLATWTRSMVEKYPASSWAVVGIVTAVSISAAAFFIYKRFISRSGKYCARYKGQTKRDCVRKFKMNAMKATILSLNSAKNGCAGTRNPEKCEINYDKKIQMWWQRLQEMDRKIL